MRDLFGRRKVCVTKEGGRPVRLILEKQSLCDGENWRVKDRADARFFTRKCTKRRSLAGALCASDQLLAEAVAAFSQQ